MRVYHSSSEKVAEVQGCKMLGNPKVYAKIKDLMEKEDEKLLVSKSFIIQKLLNAALTDIIDYVELKKDEGSQFSKLIIKDLNSIPRELRWMIQGLKPTKAGIEIKLVDKLKTLELLGQYLSLFSNNIKSTSLDNFSDNLKEFRLSLQSNGQLVNRLTKAVLDE